MGSKSIFKLLNIAVINVLIIGSASAQDLSDATETISVAQENNQSKRNNLKEVQIVHKSPIQVVKESPFNVVALDAKSLYNTTSSLNDLLNKASGVRIREIGGVGSNSAISLNGFTGKHVKIFIDGVPMDGFGSAFRLNNIPLGIADRIEVYKGVVPIEFGGDAMGGVINIVTKKVARSYLDASYSYGSFNTHKVNVDAGYTSKSGFTAQLTAYENYSDNSYKVLTQVLDLNTGMYKEQNQWVKRFNDSYENMGVIAKVGFVKKPWADRFIIGVTAGKETAEIQNANIMRIVYGEKWRSANILMPTLTYAKKDLFIKNLNANLTATYNYSLNNNYDTARRQYNWLGESRIKNSNGEGIASMSEYVNKNGSVIANLTYQPHEKHRIAVNNTLTTFERSMTEKAIQADNAISAADTMRRVQFKNILAASYQFIPNKHWNVNVFAKHFSQNIHGPIDTSKVAGTEKYVEKNMVYNDLGYGIATTYKFDMGLQAKVSFEKGLRLPTENELFGDGVLERGSAGIRSEYSNNFNIGFTYNKDINEDHSLFVDASYMYRDINDYIRREVNDQKYGSAYYYNFGTVSNKGINFEVKYFYKKMLSVGGNVTYQELINEEPLKANSTVKSNIYKDRVPNVPYFFGNTDISLYLQNVFSKGDRIAITHNMMYTHEFYIDWPSLGTKNSKDKLPTQISHDLLATYMMKNGMYNITFEVRNLTNALLYDNFSLQKPGRSFNVKLRYYISKQGRK